MQFWKPERDSFCKVAPYRSPIKSHLTTNRRKNLHHSAQQFGSSSRAIEKKTLYSGVITKVVFFFICARVTNRSYKLRVFLFRSNERFITRFLSRRSREKCFYTTDECHLLALCVCVGDSRRCVATLLPPLCADAAATPSVESINPSGKVTKGIRRKQWDFIFSEVGKLRESFLLTLFVVTFLPFFCGICSSSSFTMIIVDTLKEKGWMGSLA